MKKILVALILLLSADLVMADNATVAPPKPVNPEPPKVVNENEAPRIEEVGKKTQGKKRLARKSKNAKRRLASAKIAKKRNKKKRRN